MKKIVISLSAVIFIIANIGLSQDIINETGKDGKFIVRDAEQQEALIVEDGNVAITGGLKIETMPEGKSTDDMVVWDKNNKSLKVVPRVFSKVSPLSEPLDTRSWHSLGYGEVDEFGNEISASVQGVEAVSWNSFYTDYGFIKLGPANTFYAHIFTDRTRFLFNKPVTFLDAKFGSAAGQDFHIETGGIARLAIDAPTGNVGIGTTNPVNKLHLYDAGNYGDLWIEDTLPFVWFEASVGGNSGLSFQEGAGNYKGWIYHHGATDGVTISGRNVGYPQGDLFAANDGNIGINTTAPAFRLDVNDGTINVIPPAANDIALRVNGKEAIYESSDLFSWGFGGNDNFFARRVGVGRHPGTMFDVQQSNSVVVARFRNTSSNTDADGIRISLTPAVPTTDAHYIDFTDNGEASWGGWIGANGSGGCLYSTTSDARLKMNIVDSPNALEKVSKIKVKQYEMKSAPGKTQTGFLAQELMEIYPQAVSGDPTSNVDDAPMGIDYGRITPLLVKAIQELQAEIEILKSR